MKYALAAVILLLSACQKPPQAPASFAERVAAAEAQENSPTGVLYIGAVVKEHGERLESFIGKCYGQSGLDKDSFQLVADIAADGQFGNVVVRPETVPARCYAGKIDALRTSAPRPVGYGEKPFPLFINVNFNR
ncbi:hypothetical protein GCM10010960_14380 [Arenimonas maotaiensis]|uniref:Lipoprotein n=1 Tax=Arenimonas maotaiensis TaxID=1446479 RepID=A0A917FMF3_9GAMM|nr:hypothetical protein [Arenimonas maotaiensis]GGF93720.1 hypothetical protein GCM10010960_14380 [Arenimonas maotaiensis]